MATLRPRSTTCAASTSDWTVSRPCCEKVEGNRGSVVSEQMSDEALELFVARRMAELMVERWDRDDPDHAGELYIRPVELETLPN